MKPNWPSAVVAVGFLALVGLMFWRATDSDDFENIWAAVGTVVGVVVGAIPSFFFKSQADEARVVATEATERAERYAAIANPDLAAVIAAE